MNARRQKESWLAMLTKRITVAHLALGLAVTMASLCGAVITGSFNKGVEYSTLKSDITGLKTTQTEFYALRTSFGETKRQVEQNVRDIGTTREDIKQMRSDVQGLQSGISGLSAKMDLVLGILMKRNGG